MAQPDEGKEGLVSLGDKDLLQTGLTPDYALPHFQA